MLGNDRGRKGSMLFPTMALRSTILLLPLCLVLVSKSRASVETPVPIVFPDDAGILDVRDFGAVPDDGRDDTEAIQAALDKFPNGNRIVYLPPGVFEVRDTLRWPGSNPGNAQKRTILQGAGESLSTILLPKRTRGFEDPNQPKAVAWTGGRPAQRFRNAVRDLTIEIGEENRGAIGLQFNASNQGGIFNVTLRAPANAGKIGLDLGHTDEIGPLLVRHLTVEGFEIGISSKWPVNSNTFEHVRLIRQRRFGWWNYHQMIFVRGLISENRVTALFNEKNSWGTVTLLDSHLHGVDAHRNQPGILNQRHMALRNVDIVGYRKAVDHADKGRDKGDIDPPGTIVDDTSHRTVASLFREVEDGTWKTAGEIRELPVKETPQVPWGRIEQDWVNLVDFGADPSGEKDSSAALQRAIDSGRATVYLPAGANFRFEEAVRIRGPVSRIIGLEGRFTTAGEAVWRFVDGDHPEGLPDAPVVRIERMTHRSGGASIRIRHESDRTLVVASTIGFEIESYGAGDLFLDDFCGHLDRLAPGQSAWCRQLNSERRGLKCRNEGGRLWILGYKTEKTGTLIETTRGGHTEANGVFLYSNQPWEAEVPAFVVEDASMILRGVNERNFNRSPVQIWVEETQGGETRKLEERPWVYLSR